MYIYAKYKDPLKYKQNALQYWFQTVLVKTKWLKIYKYCWDHRTISNFRCWWLEYNYSHSANTNGNMKYLPAALSSYLENCLICAQRAVLSVNVLFNVSKNSTQVWTLTLLTRKMWNNSDIWQHFINYENNSCGEGGQLWALKLMIKY